MTEDQQQTGTPRWVKVFGIGTLVVIALAVVVFIAGQGGHGPGRHGQGDSSGAPVAFVAAF